MDLSKNFELKVFDSIPEKFVDQVDKLLENNESNNRINDQNTLSEYSKENFNNQKDRINYIAAFTVKEVIGIVIVFKRKIEFKDKKIILGGLGGVGTKKEYRGRGIASSMLKLAQKILRESDSDVAYLDTDIKDPVMLKMYGRLGFELLNRSHTYKGKSGKKYFANNGMIAPINSLDIFNEIMNEDKPFDLGGSNW
ncbi:MAG TPA: GNAT family N-acetyltransferase [Candidatus Limnocylindrales bacterium]|nr:GNAT family N-acetyltransferase [Candidatus Limnocylindrales bacterium]